MKKIYLQLIMLFAFNILMAQQKGADKIIIKNARLASDNFLSVKLIFAEKGIEITSQDKDVFQMKTVVTPITKYGAGSYYIVFCKDNSIQITGYFNTGLELNTLVKDTDPFKQIVNRKGGLWGEAWKAMNNLALLFGQDIQYVGGEELKKVTTKRDKYKDDVY